MLTYPGPARLLANGTVLLAGGYSHGFDGDAQPEWDTMFATELFNPTTSVSTAAAILEQDRAEHVATTLNDGEVLIAGGIAGHQGPCCHPKPFVALWPLPNSTSEGAGSGLLLTYNESVSIQ